MLCQIPAIAKGVISLLASGRISSADFRSQLLPQIVSMNAQGNKICLYIEADVLLEGWDQQSLSGVDEVRMPVMDALVFVGGPDWVGYAVRLLGPMMQAEVAWFPLEQKAEAISWITARS